MKTKGQYISNQLPFKIEVASSILRKPKSEIFKGSISGLLKKVNPLKEKEILKKVGKKPTTEEKIFEVLTNDEIRQGPKYFLADNKAEILDKIKIRTRKNLPIHITIMGFPGKMPNPLKCTRPLPDLGEAAYFMRISQIGKLIKKVYKPGVIFICILEAIALGTLVGLKPKEVRNYNTYLKDLLKTLKINEGVKFVELTKLMIKDKNFNKNWRKFRTKYEKLYQKDKNTELEVTKVAKVLETCIDLRSKSYEELFTMFGKKGLDKDLKSKVVGITLDYLSFHATRKETGFMDKYFPESLSGTASPKPGNINLHLINARNVLLPYHGVPLLKKGSLVITHEIEILQSPNKFRAYYLKGEKTPFFYKTI